MVTLSQRQLQRLRVIEKAVDGRLSVSEAAHLLQRTYRFSIAEGAHSLVY
jgi:hypothetical protein